MSGVRVPLVPAETDDPDLAAAFKPFLDHGRQAPDLYRALGNAPKLLRAWTDFAWPLRNDAESDRGLRELVIMRVAQLTDAETEWAAHWDMAVKHGNPPEKLAQLGAWRDSDAFSPAERAVLAFTDEVTRDLEPGEETFAALEEEFPPGQVIELLLTAAFYSCVSRVLRTLRLPPPPKPPEVAAAMRPS